MMTPAERSKLARRSRRKGKRGERSVASILKTAGWEARKGYNLLNEPDVVSSFPLYPEVKDQIRLNIKKAIRQVLKDKKDKKVDKQPCVIFKASRGTWWAAISLEELLRLVKVQI